jgi:AcrR family transcriptional regulator
MQSRLSRQKTISDARRALVLDAARVVFAESGIEGANIRDIAKAAGYTPGAIYSYFDSKEAIFDALLTESLQRLNNVVAQARVQKNKADKILQIKALAWFGFYAEHPRDLELFLFPVRTRKGADEAIVQDENKALRERLYEAMRPCEAALQDLGMSQADSQRESFALFAHGVGLLLLQPTGQLDQFGQSAVHLFANYLTQLLARCAQSYGPQDANISDTPTESPQVDLFTAPKDSHVA